MSESLPELITRRMRELNIRTISGLCASVSSGDSRVSYETVRKLANGEQRGTRNPQVVIGLAEMLRVSESVIREALEVEPAHGPWELPPRAQKLNAKERDVVERVIDALLQAKREGFCDSADAPESDVQLSPNVMPMRDPDLRHTTGAARKQNKS